MHGQCYRKGNGQPYARKQYIKCKPQSKIAKFNYNQWYKEEKFLDRWNEIIKEL